MRYALRNPGEDDGAIPRIDLCAHVSLVKYEEVSPEAWDEAFDAGEFAHGQELTIRCDQCGWMEVTIGIG